MPNLISPRTAVEQTLGKHGRDTHDEKDHGNWADPQAGPASVKSRVVYHGTAKAAIKKILTQGLQSPFHRLDAAKKDKAIQDMVAEGTKPQRAKEILDSIYVADNVTLALHYAGPGAIFRIEVPSSISLDPDWIDHSFAIPKSVPPEWITGVALISPGMKPEAVKFLSPDQARALKSEARIVYAPIRFE